MFARIAVALVLILKESGKRLKISLLSIAVTFVSTVEVMTDVCVCVCVCVCVAESGLTV